MTSLILLSLQYFSTPSNAFNYELSQYSKFRDQIGDNIDLFTAFFCMNLFGEKDMIG